MAAVLRAKIVKMEQWNVDTMHVGCEMLEPHDLGFIGGQYIIVNSGQVLPNGKLGKRAYSIPSSDLEQHRFDLVVKKIPGGAASNFMHGRKPGDVFEFSGPWGKYKPVEAMKDEKVLCIATDTGVTAGLGLLRGKWAASWLSQAKFIWLVPSEDYFIPARILDEWIPKDVEAVFPVFIPSVGDVSRIAASITEVKKAIGPVRWSRIYLSGDGLVVTGLKSFFINEGYGEESIITETFFNHTSLKTATAS